MPTEAIIQENRRKAVEFLRTTDLGQAFGALYENGCYCALGVMGLAVGINPANIRAGRGYDEIDMALGMDSPGFNPSSTLVQTWNDDYEWSFRAIGNRLADLWNIN